MASWPAVFIQHICSGGRLWICPTATRHSNNGSNKRKEPALFNQMLGEFLALVDSGRLARARLRGRSGLVKLD